MGEQKGHKDGHQHGHRLPDPAQVEHDQEPNRQGCGLQLVGLVGQGQKAKDGIRAAGDGDGDGQHVVD